MKDVLIDILKTLLFIFQLKKFPTYQQADYINEIIFAMKNPIDTVYFTLPAREARPLSP
jgi:hypothetical protein